MNDVDRRADEGLQQLGYEQEMKRSRGLWHALFMSLAIMAVPFAIASPIATGLVSGGPATVIWGFVFVAFFSLAVALSLAEICAKYPTSAGAYYWCYRLASPKNRLVVSWITGWVTLVGFWIASLSVAFGTSQLLVAGINIYHSDWVATQWQTYLILLGMVFVFASVGIFCNDALPTLEIFSAYWTLLGVIVVLVCLSAKAAVGRHSGGFALGHFDTSASGWTPGWSFFIGLLPAAYCFTSVCMIASMAEEVHNPTVDLPRALVWQIPVGLATGIVFTLPILFTLPDIATLLAVPGGQPIGVMFTMIMGSRGGGFGMWFIVFFVGIFCGISVGCAASRATRAFARDKAIPFHQFFSRVSPLTGVPLNAYLLSTIIQVLIGLIYLGSPTAFNAFVGVAVMCLGASNAMPIAISLVNKRKDVVDSPFSLGRLGAPLNFIAVMWIVFEIVLFSMPAVVPVTPATMNYASVVFVAFGVFSGVWYLISGRHHYNGPPEPCDLVEGKEESSTSSQTREILVEAVGVEKS